MQNNLRWNVHTYIYCTTCFSPKEKMSKSWDARDSLTGGFIAPKLLSRHVFQSLAHSSAPSTRNSSDSDWEKINNGVLGVVKKSIWKFHCHLLLLVMKVIEIDRLYWYVYKFECSINLVLKKFLHSLIIGEKTLVILGIMLLIVDHNSIIFQMMFVFVWIKQKCSALFQCIIDYACLVTVSNWLVDDVHFWRIPMCNYDVIPQHS